MNRFLIECASCGQECMVQHRGSKTPDHCAVCGSRDTYVREYEPEWKEVLSVVYTYEYLEGLGIRRTEIKGG